MVEVSEDANALELVTLDLQILFGIFAAGVADLERVHLQLFAAEGFIHFDFDGQAVAVPAGNVGRIQAAHGAGLDDEVLEALVERMAQMQGAVGVGWAVMQDVGRRAGARFPDLIVDAHGLPALEHFGLVLRQVGLHGEIGCGQIDGCLEVHSGLCLRSILNLSLYAERRIGIEGRGFRGSVKLRSPGALRESVDTSFA